jgi:hypothetical protein
MAQALSQVPKHSSNQMTAVCFKGFDQIVLLYAKSSFSHWHMLVGFPTARSVDKLRRMTRQSSNVSRAMVSGMEKPQ